MAISAKTTLAALSVALILPAQAAAAEIREQPADTPRAELVSMEWSGDEASPDVVVEYRYGLSWVTVSSTGAEHLVIADEGDGVWSASWLPTRYSPAGTYRMRVEGAGYSLVSDYFQVRPCACVVPHRLRSRWGKGAFRLRLTAEYQPRTMAGFLLTPATVQTGRPLVRVLRDGRRIGSVRLRYRRGAFRGTWPGPRGPRHSVTFQLVSLTDGFGNR